MEGAAQLFVVMVIATHVKYHQGISYQIVKERPLLCREGRGIIGQLGCKELKCSVVCGRMYV
jgi:hypothetical protein